MNVRGHGLGLSICKQICENLGGYITVSSIQGHGSEFVFTNKIEKLKYKKKDTQKGEQKKVRFQEPEPTENVKPPENPKTQPLKAKISDKSLPSIKEMQSANQIQSFLQPFEEIEIKPERKVSKALAEDLSKIGFSLANQTGKSQIEQSCLNQFSSVQSENNFDTLEITP